ncbi:uncharacterized protein PAC_01690 [Phialocephala subalpina]|uniref:RBR-type E3 ubiquitin transferase n=1 Tax=Phialocephala subalpina TaxID=576137 RepID=A0A1L7WGC2_9HELO|nr:uncharacterized protein PAC_01690 [Phialocephala subalpina]
MGTVKSKIKARDDTVFGQRFEDLEFETLKRILNIYYQKTGPDDSARDLFNRVKVLEGQLDDDDKRTIRQVLERGDTLTRQALKKGKPLCSICTNRFASPNVVISGGHRGCILRDYVTCKTCAETYITSYMSNTSWERIPCMFCGLALPQESIKQLISGDILEKYTTFLELNPIRNLPNFRWCQNPQCSQGQIHAKGSKQPKMTCRKCSFAACFNHQKPWHNNQTCEEYDKTTNPKDLKAEAASLKKIQKSAGICPHCAAPAFKHGGCGTVHCRCGYSYDWKAAIGKKSDGTLAMYEAGGVQVAR